MAGVLFRRGTPPLSSSTAPVEVGVCSCTRIKWCKNFSINLVSEIVNRRKKEPGVRKWRKECESPKHRQQYKQYRPNSMFLRKKDPLYGVATIICSNPSTPSYCTEDFVMTYRNNRTMASSCKSCTWRRRNKKKTLIRSKRKYNSRPNKNKTKRCWIFLSSYVRKCQFKQLNSFLLAAFHQCLGLFRSGAGPRLLHDGQQRIHQQGTRPRTDTSRDDDLFQRRPRFDTGREREQMKKGGV